MKRITILFAVAAALAPLFVHGQQQAPGTVSSGAPASGTEAPATRPPRGPAGSAATSPISTPIDPRIGAHGYAQFLVDNTLARYPEIEVMTLHARTPSIGPDYPIVASNIGRLGQRADPGDLAVIETGQPHNAVDDKGRRFES